MSDEMARVWVIVGAGRVGRLLGLLGAQSSLCERVVTWNRTSAQAAETAEVLGIGVRDALWGERVSEALGEVWGGVERPLVWLTVVDDVLAGVAGELAGCSRDDWAVLHVAGSVSSQVLREARMRGEVGSLHPLQAIADPVVALAEVARCVWSVEGDAGAVALAEAIMGEVGVVPIRLDASRKALYHASAVMAANLLVALMDAAFSVAHEAGVSSEADVRRMLLPLAQSGLLNLWERSTREALTGPVARGDVSTLARHEEALRALGDEELWRVYEVLTQRAKTLMARHDAK